MAFSQRVSAAKSPQGADSGRAGARAEPPRAGGYAAREAGGADCPLGRARGHAEPGCWGCYSAKEIEDLRAQLSLSNWDRGGELSRFAFLHAPLFFRTSVLHRAGPVAALDWAPLSEVAAHPVRTGGGGAGGRTPYLQRLRLESPTLTFDEYVCRGGAAIDGLIILHQGRIVYERYPRMRPLDYV